MRIPDLSRRATEHALETIWWNKGLTKLNSSTIDNYEEFIENIIQVQGPYLEKVQPPQQADQSWQEFCHEYGIANEIEHAIQDAIFGSETGHLYAHQDHSVRRILDSVHTPNGDDTVITVPTATGKTECFLIPALQTALENKVSEEYQSSIKSLIIYPQKALETDQLNRTVEYGYFINQHRDQLNQLTIGIYDGDTPRGAYQMYDGQNVRGLQCPECDAKLEWDDTTDTVICSQKSEHPNNRPLEIDFLNVTRDEIEEKGADVLITNPEAFEFRLFSSDTRDLVTSDVLDLVVFDEAHVWDGNGGTAVSHFIERLRERYNPTTVLASATIEKPLRFASQLLRRPEQQINHIDFKPASAFTSPSAVQSQRTDLVTPQEAFATLIESTETGNASESTDGAEALLQQIGLLDQRQPTELGNRIGDAINESNALEEDSLSQLFQRKQTLQEELADHLIKNVPEIAEIFGEFGDQDFIAVDQLTNTLFPTVDDDEKFDSLDRLLKWCKLGGILYDRYHYFLMPFSGFYYCPDCTTMHTSRHESCRVPGHTLYEVQACSRCDALYFKDEEDEYPIGDGCSCSGVYSISAQRLKVTTFLSYFLTQLGRDLKTYGEGKVLAFSNRRGDAEGVGSLMMNLDYTLEAERMLVDMLPKQGTSDSDAPMATEIEDKLQEQLRETYLKEPYGYLEDDTLYTGLSRHLYRIANPLNKDEHRKLFQSGLVSIPATDDPEISLIANELVKILAFKPHSELDQQYSIRKSSLENKLENSVETYVGAAPDLSTKIEQALNVLESRGAVRKAQEQTSDGVEIILSLRPKFLSLVLNTEARLCPHCYGGWPFWERDYCPSCGETTVPVNRDDDADTKNQNPDSDLLFPLDHWGKIIYEADSNPLVSAVHKAGIDPDTRNKIEEAFSASPPRINIVSATTTLELGIDIGTLDCIVDLGIPPTKASYTQRAGRAGRDLERSSVVFTIANPHSSVDAYYFEDIDNRFLNASPKPTRINELGDKMFRTQALSEIVTYLNQGRFNYESFERFDTDQDIETTLNKIYDGIQTFISTVQEHRDDITSHLTATFESKSESEINDAIDTLFGENGEIHRRSTRRLFKFYSLYQQLSVSGSGVSDLRRRRRIQEELTSELSSEISYLPLLLSKTGLLAQFRGSDEQAVLFREQQQNGSLEHLQYESKTVSQALRESYPEAVDTYGGTKYEVVNTQVSKQPIFEANMCLNEGCLLQLQQQPREREICPMCGDELNCQPIHDYLGAVLQPSTGSSSTRPLTLRGVDIE